MIHASKFTGRQATVGPHIYLEYQLPRCPRRAWVRDDGFCELSHLPHGAIILNDGEL